MIIYGCFSSPTPDAVGISEALVALLLFLSFRVHFRDLQTSSFYLPWAIFCYGLIIPTLLGLINGHNLGDMIRDMISFFYVMMPLFLGWIAFFKPQKFLKALTGIGLLFSIRTILSYQKILLIPSLWGQGPPADLLYLANSPEVLFSALYCIGQAGYFLLNPSSRMDRLKGLSIALIAILPIMAMGLMTQRAGIGAVFAYIVIGICYVTYHNPRSGAILILSALAFGLALSPILEPLLFLLWEKTNIVGLNARGQEWSVVTTILSDSWKTMLSGEGWGGRIENPAVGGLSVNYTHSLISSFLLKTGVIGTIGMLVTIIIPVIRTLKCIFITENRKTIPPDLTSINLTHQRLILIGAGIFPLLISVFLYASYKSLGFGLILLLFFIFPIRKLEKIN